MLGNRFSIRDAISFGWDTTCKHIFLLVKIALAITAVEIVLLIGLVPISIFLYITRESYLSLIPITLGFAYCIASVLCMIGIVRLGLIRVLLDLYERNKSDVSRLFTSFDLVFSYLVAALLFGLMIFPFSIGLAFFGIVSPQSLFALLSIVTFFVVAFIKVRFGFYMYPIVDKRVGALESLKRSWHITDGSVLRIILFELVLALIPFALGILVTASILALIGALSKHLYLAALLPVFSLIVTLFLLALVLPMVMLANVYVYKQLSGNGHAFTHDHTE